MRQKEAQLNTKHTIQRAAKVKQEVTINRRIHVNLTMMRLGEQDSIKRNKPNQYKVVEPLKYPKNSIKLGARPRNHDNTSNLQSINEMVISVKKKEFPKI